MPARFKAARAAARMSARASLNMVVLRSSGSRYEPCDGLNRRCLACGPAGLVAPATAAHDLRWHPAAGGAWSRRLAWEPSSSCACEDSLRRGLVLADEARPLA